MTNWWLKVDGNLLCKKLLGSNSINFEREGEKSQKKYTHNDLLLLAEIAIKIRITTPRAVTEGTGMFHFACWM